MTTFTPNFKLDLYEGTDKPDLADQYAAAMQKIDRALQAALEAHAELQNSIGTLNVNLTATNKAVSDNTTAIEEHVNYFAALGVTDDDSANALHTEIDNAYQGTVSNTQHLGEVDTAIQTIHDEFVDSVLSPNAQHAMINPIEGVYCSFSTAFNKNKTMLKFWGSILNNTAHDVDIPLDRVPGTSSLYGLKLSNPLDETTFFPFDSSGTHYTTRSELRPAYAVGAAVGSDGYLYVALQTKNSYTLGPNEAVLYNQAPYFLGYGDWPEPSISEI